MKTIGVIGAGNIGGAVARGLVKHGGINASRMIISRRKEKLLNEWKEEGYRVTTNNVELVEQSDVVILAVLPGQAEEVVSAIAPALTKGNKLLLSVIAAVSIEDIRKWTGSKIPVLRVIPNIAIEYGESMTCLAGDDREALKTAEELFDRVGSTLVIQERLMPAATVLAACGIAFFLRYVRAASQGGIQIGFHAEDAGRIAAQTSRGAAQILLSTGNHPEQEIDKVTTPMGFTIAGLNEMEHNGVSSALIKGIITSHAGIIGSK